MASPSEGHRNQEEPPATKEMLYKTKLIQFLGRITPIILQNDNGPCPLLAICNLLLLRNNLNLRSDVVEVSQEKLLSLVADRLIDSNSNVDNKDAGYVENQQQNIADAIDLLPRLATGIDVNIKFTRINDFEFTRECAIFDLLDIPLYHGWIVDPQDSETSNAIGLKSYNMLMGELVSLETQNPTNVFKKNNKEDCVNLVAATSENSNVTHLKKHEPSTANDNTLANDCNDDLITFETVPGQDVSSSSKSDNESPHAQMNSSVSEKHDKTSVDYDALVKPENITLSSLGSDSSPPVDILEHNSGGDEKIPAQSILTTDVNEVEKVNIGAQTIDESKSLNEHVYGGEECISETIQVDKVSTSADDTSPKDGTTARQGELITNFLKNSASQLTIYGLFSLQDGLKERELCVFFRNNHFNTMFKFEGELYILATDQGYINQPDLVWEKLNEVNGDTVFMTNNFKEFKAENHGTRSWDEQNAMANTADYLASIDNTAQTDTSFNSDLQLAIALQQQEFKQQQQPQRVLPQPTTIGRSGLVVGPQHVHPSRPRNSSSSSRQEPKPSKDKCTLM